MKSRALLILLPFLSIACGSSSHDAPEPATAGPQGIKGRVEQLTGDFMPGPDGTRGTTIEVSTAVHAYRGALPIAKLDAPFDPAEPTLVASARSDENGYYQIVLAPGEYSIAAEIGGVLFDPYAAGGFTETVRANAWQNWSIQDTRHATF